MRHKVAGKRLGRDMGHRNALRRNLINALFEHESIKTTDAKASAIRAEAEKLISIAKRALAHEDPMRGVHARRLLMARLNNKDVVAKVFSDLAPRYAERPGGYTRTYKMGMRNGDASKMVLLELVDREKA
ncbi:MAG: 50S ribosomal protein L17 [Anaerolineae bacterium]|nr:50S ribosomal protein L17 [Anaerolineae bacterium]